ncbi:MAG: hypothetical protein DHS80DRAFT_24485 [Piptocephalis tieghemiana]|nr:MAG: hypothetical protein DHS80DRAFT_24485 [Piptocephalis tieghemiana]
MLTQLLALLALLALYGPQPSQASTDPGLLCYHDITHKIQQLTKGSCPEDTRQLSASDVACVDLTKQVRTTIDQSTTPASCPEGAVLGRFVDFIRDTDKPQIGETMIPFFLCRAPDSSVGMVTIGCPKGTESIAFSSMGCRDIKTGAYADPNPTEGTCGENQAIVSILDYTCPQKPCKPGDTMRPLNGVVPPTLPSGGVLDGSTMDLGSGQNATTGDQAVSQSEDASIVGSDGASTNPVFTDVTGNYHYQGPIFCQDKPGSPLALTPPQGCPQGSSPIPGYMVICLDPITRTLSKPNQGSCPKPSRPMYARDWACPFSKVLPTGVCPPDTPLISSTISANGLLYCTDKSNGTVTISNDLLTCNENYYIMDDGNRAYCIDSNSKMLVPMNSDNSCPDNAVSIDIALFECGKGSNILASQCNGSVPLNFISDPKAQELLLTRYQFARAASLEMRASASDILVKRFPDFYSIQNSNDSQDESTTNSQENQATSGSDQSEKVDQLPKDEL